MNEIKYFYSLQIFHIVCSYFIFYLLILSGLFSNSSVKSPTVLSVKAIQLLLASLQEWTSLVAQMVKNLPAKQKMQVQSLGWEDPLEEGMATHSSILAWKIPWTVRLQSKESHRARHDLATNSNTFLTGIQALFHGK